MPARINIPFGTPFGKLIVQRLADKRGRRGEVYWSCLCECGRTTDVRSCHLRNGLITSCGKCPRESKPLTHGMSYSPEHGVWSHIKARCLSPTDPAWDRYGGRGITMFEPWIKDFQAFYDYVGPRPSSEYTMERIDNNKGYEPGNVRWDTRTAQARNRRSNLMLTLNGKTMCAAQWAEVVPINLPSICARKRLGWSDKRALTQPLRYHPNQRPSQLKLVV